MSGDVLGGGLVVVVAAVLWLAYLIPNWVQRREYLATERNVVRLQQTLRILAETAEVPQEVRVEASARDVAAQQRMLKEVERRRRADTWLQLRAARVANVTPTAPVAAAARAAAQLPLALQRRRRGRIATTLVLTFGVVAAGFGTAQLATFGTWGLLAAGAVLVVAALGMLRRLARPVAGRASAPQATGIEPVFDHSAFADPAPAVSREWTPQPLPRPLHLSKGSAAAGMMASADAAAELRRALARSQMGLRSAERAALVAASAEAPAHSGYPEPAAAEPPQQPSRFAGMGLVDDQPPAAIDLNEVLRRRRAV